MRFESLESRELLSASDCALLALESTSAPSSIFSNAELGNDEEIDLTNLTNESQDSSNMTYAPENTTTNCTVDVDSDSSRYFSVAAPNDYDSLPPEDGLSSVLKSNGNST